MGFDIWRIAVDLPCVLIALALHEFGHAAMADKLGDYTPRAQKRVTLNPLAHLDPMGTLMIFYTAITGAPGIGWGKPVQSNPMAYRNYRQGRILVALAGPAMNLALAMLGIAVSYVVFLAERSSAEATPPLLHLILTSFVTINFRLMFFNLIPVPPLDGHHVLAMYLPFELRRKYEGIGMYGMLIIFGLLFLGVIGLYFRLIFGLIHWLIAMGFGEGFARFLMGG